VTPTPPGPDDLDDATGDPEPGGECQQAAPPTPTPELTCRIDPKDLQVDWDTEGITDDDDTGPDARLGRPPRSDFVRAHPTFKFGIHLIDLTDTHGMEAIYVLSKSVAEKLLDEDEPVQAAEIYLLAAREGGYVFWAIKIGNPTEPRKPSSYVRTARAAVQAAREGWVKIRWRGNGQNAGYKTRKARVEIPDLDWPPDPRALFLETARDHYIESVDDPVIRKLLGEA
jgi:hypothetical protein